MSRALFPSRPTVALASGRMPADRARSRRWHAAVFGGYVLLAAALVVSRRPDAVLNAQFWAEDGAVWYADAYNHGWAPLLWTHTGYHQVTSSLAAVLAQPLGLGSAPALFNAVALSLQVLPALFIVSARFDRVIPSLPVRYAIGAIYLAIPAEEVHGNITNAQWHWALLTLMVILARPAPTWRWRVVDMTVLVLGSLSGPLVIVLAPLAVVRWLASRERWHLILASTASVLAAVQAVTALDSAAVRSHAPLGAGLRVLAHILVNRVLLTGVSGEESTPGFSTEAWPHGALIAAALAIGGALLLALVIWKGQLELRLLVAFAALALCMALARPQVNATAPQWPMMVHGPGAGARYFLIPVVALVVSLVWLMSRLSGVARGALAGAWCTLFLMGAIGHWTYAPYSDFHPAAEAAQLARATPGTEVTLPINPPGWVMVLRRH
jgi:hypothetical protein